MKRKMMLCLTLTATCALFSGCAWTTKISKYMTAASNVPTSPPSGKALVCIHRENNIGGHSLYYFNIWDNTKFIADIGNGQSLAYVCEPGKHFFLSRFPGWDSCVEAELLPDKTYDFWTERVWAQKLQPLHQDDKTRRRVAEWTKANQWIEPALSAVSYEKEYQDKIRQLLEEFTSGKRQEKLQHLAPDDHR